MNGFVIVVGIDRPRMIGSGIHLGEPGGPRIFDLGSGQTWKWLEQDAALNVLDDAPIPPEHLKALVGGQTFLVIETPEGAIKGRIVAPGDMNCDGAINNFDIDPFVLALTDPHGYGQQYPDCDFMQADINADAEVNNFDIDPFVKLLTR